VILPGGQEFWNAFDVTDAGLLRRAILPAPFALPTDEYVHVPGGLESKSEAYRPLRRGYAPALWLTTPFTPGTYKIPLSGENGLAQVADAAGNLDSDQHYDLFGSVLAKICPGPVPVPSFQGLDHVDGLDPLFHIVENFQYPDLGSRMDPHLGGKSPDDPDPGVLEPVPYLPGTGSFQSDLGFGPDGLFAFLAQDEPPKPPAPPKQEEPVIIETEMLELTLTGVSGPGPHRPILPVPPPKEPGPRWVSAMAVSDLESAVTLEEIRQRQELDAILEIVRGGGCVLVKPTEPRGKKWWK
jgi:hypothetical protein